MALTTLRRLGMKWELHSSNFLHTTGEKPAHILSCGIYVFRARWNVEMEWSVHIKTLQKITGNTEISNYSTTLAVQTCGQYIENWGHP